VTPSGIEPATFRFVAQYLNYYTTAYPARAVESMINRRVDDIITDAVHGANFVKEMGEPGMIKAPDGDTILDENNVNPIY
jgi:hypothetical protein